MDVERDTPKSVESDAYMVDYYALFGIPRNADNSTIEEAWKSQISMYHEDRYGSWAPPEFKEKARYMGRVLGSARETLLDPDRRAAYDLTLLSWRRAISTDGYPVTSKEDLAFRGIELTSDTFDNDLKAILDKATTIAGFDSQMFDFIERMFEGSDNPDMGLMATYKNALSRKDFYLALQEVVRRAAIGMATKKVDLPDSDYFTQTQDEIKTRRQEVEAELLEELSPVIEINPDDVHMLNNLTRLVQNPEVARFLGSGDLLRLNAGSEAEGGDQKVALQSSDEPLDEIFYLRRFDTQADLILELAKAREKVIAKRLDFVRPVYEIEQPVTYNRVVLYFRVSDGMASFVFEKTDDGNGESSIRQIDITDEETRKLVDSEDVQKLIENRYNVIHLLHEDGLLPISEIGKVLNAHYERE